ncbi:porin [Kaarinaea lacus]
MKMKHSLIALAVAGATSAAVVTPAQAEVTAYGLAQVEIGAVSYQTENAACANAAKQDQTVTAGCDGLDVIDNANGRVGLKASEDLGNGMTGMAKFEFKADTADNQTSSGVSLTARESLVGLKANWGQVELGRLKSAYKYAGGVKYDAFVATLLEARGNGGMSGNSVYTKNLNIPDGNFGHNGFLPNNIGYEYGGKTGFGVRLTYGAADGDGSITASAMFAQDNWEVFAAMVDTGDLGDSGFGESYSAVKAGGMFKMGAHKFMLQYEQTSLDPGSTVGATKIEPTYIFAAWNMKMGKNTFVVNYGMLDSDETGSPNHDTTYYALGVQHHFTKGTSIFGGYRASDVDDDSYAEGKESVFSVGLKQVF